MTPASTEEPAVSLERPVPSMATLSGVVRPDPSSLPAGAGDTSFNLAMYPHIQDNIIQSAPPQALAVLRATSRELCRAVSRSQPMIKYEWRRQHDRPNKILFVSTRPHGRAGTLLDTKEWDVDKSQGWDSDDLGKTQRSEAVVERVKQMREDHAKVDPWVVDIVGTVRAMANIRVPIVRLHVGWSGRLSYEPIMTAHTVVVFAPFTNVTSPHSGILAFPALSHFESKAAKRIVFNVREKRIIMGLELDQALWWKESFWSPKAGSELSNAVIIFQPDLADPAIVTGSLAIEVTGLFLKHPDVTVTIVNAHNVQPSLLGRDGCWFDRRHPAARTDCDPRYCRRMGADHTEGVDIGIDCRVIADVTATLAPIIGTTSAEAAASRIRFLTMDEYRATLYPGQWEMETDGMMDAIPCPNV